MSKPTCLVTAPVATRSGYGAHSRDICRALIKLDKYDVKIWAVRWGNTPMNALIEGDPNDDVMMSSEAMSQNFIDHMDGAFDNWKPRKRYSIFKA